MDQSERERIWKLLDLELFSFTELLLIAHWVLFAKHKLDKFLRKIDLGYAQKAAFKDAKES